MLIVQKFGGSSVNGLSGLRRCAEIVLQAAAAGDRPVVVVSAMGKSTDALAEMALAIDPQPSKREWDALLCTGEQQSAALMAMMLQHLGGRARSLTGWQSGLLTDRLHGDANIRYSQPLRVLETIQQGMIPVITGFQGIDDQGDLTTLGRGGSDTTAVALAAALCADRCCIYSDVAGICTADPRLIPGARHLERMDFRDMLALAHSGSQLLHAKSVSIAMEESVELELLSSFGDPARSTVCFLQEQERPDYAGITRDLSRCQLTLVGKACCVQTLRNITALLNQSACPVLGGKTGEGFVWVRLAEEHLLPGLARIHESYFEK